MTNKYKEAAKAIGQFGLTDKDEIKRVIEVMSIPEGVACPKCDKRSTCGCKSCRKRKKMSKLRVYKLSGDLIGCPYCRTLMHCDSWLDSEAKDYNLKQLSN